MFDQSNQAKSEEERKMLIEMYFEEADDSNANPQGLKASFVRLNQLITAPVRQFWAKFLAICMAVKRTLFLVWTPACAAMKI